MSPTAEFTRDYSVLVDEKSLEKKESQVDDNRSHVLYDVLRSIAKLFELRVVWIRLCDVQVDMLCRLDEIKGGDCDQVRECFVATCWQDEVIQW